MSESDLTAEPSDLQPEPSDPTPDQSDRVKPWTIKGITPEIRNAAIAAADRADEAIGEWITRAIRTQVKADHNASREVTRTDQAAPQVDLGEIERLIAMAQSMATITNEPPPVGVTRLAYGLLRDRLKAAKSSSGRT